MSLRNDKIYDGHRAESCRNSQLIGENPKLTKLKCMVIHLCQRILAPQVVLNLKRCRQILSPLSAERIFHANRILPKPNIVRHCNFSWPTTPKCFQNVPYSCVFTKNTPLSVTVSIRIVTYLSQYPWSKSCLQLVVLNWNPPNCVSQLWNKFYNSISR